jgi:glycine cleavage system H protein
MTEQSWFGCIVPDDLLYDLDRDVWVRRLDNGEVECGMTDVAQTRCGRFVGVSWKHPGKQVKQGRPMAVIESAKWVGPFPAPLSGQITADNRLAFEEDIAVANRDPYGAGWLIRLRPSDFDGESGHLVDGTTAFEHYRKIIEDEGIRCFRCED